MDGRGEKRRGCAAGHETLDAAVAHAEARNPHLAIRGVVNSCQNSGRAPEPWQAARLYTFGAPSHINGVRVVASLVGDGPRTAFSEPRGEAHVADQLLGCGSGEALEIVRAVGGPFGRRAAYLLAARWRADASITGRRGSERRYVYRRSRREIAVANAPRRRRVCGPRRRNQAPYRKPYPQR